MIRINLLGAEKGKKSAPAVAAAANEAGGSTRGVALLCLAILVLAVAGNAFYYYRLTREAAQLQVDMAAANAEYARLAQVKVRYDDLIRQRDAYKNRVDVIDELRARQAGPVTLLITLGDTVAQTRQLWLNSMGDDGKAVTLKGRALSVHAVADLMQSLQASGYFRNIEFKTSTQDEKLKDVQAFQFEMTCEKKTAAPPPAATAPPARRS